MSDRTFRDFFYIYIHLPLFFKYFMQFCLSVKIFSIFCLYLYIYFMLLEYLPVVVNVMYQAFYVGPERYHVLFT